MTHLSYVTTLDVSKQQLWQVLAQRFGEIGEISAGVVSSSYLTDTTTGIGTTRYCQLSHRGFMQERVTIWQEETTFAFEIERSSLPLEAGATLTFHLHALNLTTTEVIVSGEYRLKRAARLSPLFRPVLRHVVKTMLAEVRAAIHAGDTNCHKVHPQVLSELSEV
ncbi:MAG: SRPBCC family protein [Deinococcota bacterium]